MLYPQVPSGSGPSYVCQEAGCGRREEGLRSIETHMEAHHPAIGAHTILDISYLLEIK